MDRAVKVSIANQLLKIDSIVAKITVNLLDFSYDYIWIKLMTKFISDRIQFAPLFTVLEK